MTRRHPAGRHRSLWLLALLAVVGLFAAACSDDDDEVGSSGEAGDEDGAASTTAADGDGAGDGAAPADGPTITIGAQDFGESAILAQLYGQALSDAGYDVSYQSLGGFRDVVYTAFESGDINFTAEYAASALEFLTDFAGTATSDIDETAGLLGEALAGRDLVALDPSPAVDSNAFVVTPETAEELGLAAVSDLTEDLSLGGPPDCEENAFCIPGLVDVYGIDLSAGFVPLDGGGPLTREALAGGEIDVAILFSTDSTIAENGWVVLEDDQGLINADNVIPVMTQELLDAYGDDFRAIIDAVSAALTTEELTELNRRFDVDKEDADAVARAWLAEEGLISG